VAAVPREEKAFQLRPVYFPRTRFNSIADCLTAAYSQQLPPDVCR
jgi:hypothetical protein